MNLEKGKVGLSANLLNLEMEIEGCQMASIVSVSKTEDQSSKRGNVQDNICEYDRKSIND